MTDKFNAECVFNAMVDDGRYVKMTGRCSDIEKIVLELKAHRKCSAKVESLTTDVAMLTQALEAARGELERLRTLEANVREDMSFGTDPFADWSLDPDGDWVPQCEICGEKMEWYACAKCEGRGGEVGRFEPYEFDPCEDCHGQGGGYECPNRQHTTTEPEWGPGEITLVAISGSLRERTVWRTKHWWQRKVSPLVDFTLYLLDFCTDCRKPWWGPWKDKHENCIPF
jgi:hypothetical protein